MAATRAARSEPFDGPASGLTWSEEEVAGTAAKAYARIAAAWRLRNEEAAGLIDVSPRTWARMKAGNWSGRLSKDQLLRISGVTGLYKALHLYFSDPLADEWVGLANAGQSFGGQTPKDVMIGSGLPAILQTRDYVDALRGGV
ncbi:MULTISPECIES: antitoxin Xre-like helix-turn-helix domain-containing protein [unclassified Mesorhizobium]|uniref:antitoxin Xre-like helix-turn-helix domain-containing protein n=1 Tax=unclassified Mesorhizobium TaxID=325217 RepID=UPI001FCDEBF8|nr:MULTISPECIES: antitoxin Xre-like helix-turn-helix domain-containing protein [unclassified Mesorhizobium]